MSVSIIIPVYKRTEWLQKCLSALDAQSYEGEFEVVVVDDGSPNVEQIRKVVDDVHSASCLVLNFFRKENGGPAKARNLGVRFSKGEILCFLDDDSVPDPAWLLAITAPFQEGGVGVASGRTLSFDRENHFPLLLERAVYSGKSWATCNIAYRREVFDRLGGFDESFPEPSWEDNDLGLRARWAGFSHVFSPEAVVYHPHEQSPAEYRAKCLLNGRGVAVFSRKYWRSKPLWGIGAPFLMARRLIYGLSPIAWINGYRSCAFMKFLWSFYSAQGFIGALFGSRYGKNAQG